MIKIIRTLSFVGGLSTSFIILGFGAILGAVLGISASGGQATYGAWLMLIYAIGLVMPFLIISIFSDLLLVKMKVLNKHMGKIKVVGGILIMIMGLLLMTDNLNLITVFFERL